MKSSSNNFDKLRAAMGALDKKYPGLIKTGDEIPYIRRVPFKEPSLDFVSDGGLPLGRFIELIGPEHSGKTRNALRGLGQYQKFCLNCGTPDSLTVEWDASGDIPEVKSISCSCCDKPETRVCAIVDLEHTIDVDFLRIMGVDPMGVVYVSPDVPSAAVGITETFIRNPSIGYILFDSFGVMGSDREVENPIEENKMNLNPAFLNQTFRKWQAALNGDANESGVDNKVVVVINQTYMSLGLYSQDIPQGGRGLRHGKAMSMKTSIITKMKEKDEVLGVHIRIVNEKNKSGVPYRRAEYVLMLDPAQPELYCTTNTIIQYIEVGLALGVIKQSGAWFSWGTYRWQGKAKIVDDFDGATGLKEAIDEKLYKSNSR